ncbi:NUDIX domain-containing protein [Micromonospora sp. DT231]|uniref:NUDIX domain-containing protein n=1 Tax=Micromonospora sp. DT231 TaxID=3416526 RepID=UPI003CE8F584
MTWTEPATWHANLASFYVAAPAFITGPDGKLLLVKPNHRDHWSFPGGYVSENEYPHEACDSSVAHQLKNLIKV